MTTGDNQLAQAAANGDQSAFASLLDRHYDRLFGLCFRLLGRKDAAEDLTQDICLALPAKLAGFRGDSKFTTWLYRVAVNAAHDLRRRSATRAQAADGWGDWERGRREEIAETSAQVDWLRETMAILPAELRDTLALTMDDDMTQAEAGQVLGISEGTVAWRLSEVRKRLREQHERELK